MIDDDSPAPASSPSLDAFESRYGNDYIVFDGDIIDDVHVEHFNPTHFAAQGGLLGQAQGRGTTFFIQWQGMACVLRHYRRGGWMARWNKDRYWWSGVDNTRAWREWYLLQQMFAQGLPVPRPLAAHVSHAGLFYRADLITRRIDDAHSLARLLGDTALRELFLHPHSTSRHLWTQVGTTIHQFHACGIYHADLNAHNILLKADGQCYLIDFDKGEQRTPRSDWQEANLKRLQRSLYKLKSQQSDFYFEETDWSALMQGYTQE